LNSKLFLAGVAFLVILLLPVVAQASTLPFINEIHYDNVGSDLNEGVEIAGPAGFDLSAWRLCLYNGLDGSAYNTVSLLGAIASQQNGYGVIWFPISGMQNGAPDGIALIDPGNLPIQFLSYEGSFTASSGPALGVTSINLGVGEDNPIPIVGNSLQLTGTGSMYPDFSWSGPIASTPGAINAGQAFLGTVAIPEPATLSILGIGLFFLAGGNFVRKHNK
jgi:hypothetical protein